MNITGTWMIRNVLIASLGLALPLAGLSALTGCCNLADLESTSETEDESDDEEEKKEKVKLKSSYYSWACAAHPAKKKTISVPAKGEESDDDEAAKLRKLVKQLSEEGDDSPPPVFDASIVGDDTVVAVVMKKSSKTGYKKGQRFILYDPGEVSSASDGTLLFLLAHALGHHSLKHKKSSSKFEPEADNHAGYLLGLQGKSLVDVTKWLSTKAPASDRAERIKQATEGWNKGCKKSKKCGASATPTPSSPTPDSSGPKKKYRSYGDRDGI